MRGVFGENSERGANLRKNYGFTGVKWLIFAEFFMEFGGNNWGGEGGEESENEGEGVDGDGFGEEGERAEENEDLEENGSKEG